MANRPNYLDLRSTAGTPVARPLRSPRLHVAGEVPPALSPLDAFAAQSRLLSKQLEESAKNGNRVSRLPPLTTESPLVVQGRSEYFRSLSHDSSEEQNGLSPKQPTGLGLTTEIESPTERPVSMHPRMSHIPPTPSDPVPPLPNPFAKDGSRGRFAEPPNSENGLYGARREQSPADWEPEPQSAGHQGSARGTSPSRGRFPSSPDKLTKTISNDSANLIPPRPSYPKRSSSHITGPTDSFNEDIALASSSFHPQSTRKLSSGSALSGPVLPSPIAHYQRSPSISSDASVPLPRPAFNFSRPLSRAGTPSLEGPSRQASSDSHPSFVLADDSAQTPVSMHSDVFAENSMGGGDKYSRYSLPRGKPLQRDAPPSQDEHSSSFVSYEVPPTPVSRQAPPSPPTRPSSSSSRYQDNPIAGDALIGRPSLERSKLSTEMTADREPLPEPTRPSTSDSRQSVDVPRGRTLTSATHDQAQARTRTPVSVTTSDSASTIKPPKSQHAAPAAAEISPEEHLAKGIKCHEEGSVKESTYHLRLAANGGDPTGMLLYALACRHGWGMRPNQREGVQWLRKAADIVSAEIAEAEKNPNASKAADFLDKKTRKAQFALSIYELGVSHMNGWGIEQDKALALRCFEISGSWGDVDALAEAGFCYAQGVGCKKDLKKSAKFYRMAEAKGMSMPGNSWIHKSKYADDSSSTKSGNARSKSKSRGIFGKK
ncbi:hypothetical protein GGR50DRAFT_659111 [Xylaria sp. CBS 124048]|nr:hypothetical protein GGR50DRAFT_659111 [Xylaria sp. CBS 124048]